MELGGGEKGGKSLLMPQVVPQKSPPRVLAAGADGKMETGVPGDHAAAAPGDASRLPTASPPGKSQGSPGLPTQNGFQPPRKARGGLPTEPAAGAPGSLRDRRLVFWAAGPG